MKKFSIAIVAMFVSFSSIMSVAQAQSTRNVRSVYDELIRRAPDDRACHAPLCTVRPGATRHALASDAEYQEGITFLIPRSDASGNPLPRPPQCLLECRCILTNAAVPSYCPAVATAPATTPTVTRAAVVLQTVDVTSTTSSQATTQTSTTTSATVAPNATAAPTLETPLSPYMPNMSAQGMGMAGIGWCPAAFTTIGLLQGGMATEGVWWSNATAPWQRTAMQTGGRSIRFTFNNPQYAMAVGINGRSVVPLTGGNPTTVVHRISDGSGYCANPVVPAQSQTSFHMLLENMTPFDLTIACYSVISGQAAAPFRIVHLRNIDPQYIRNGEYTITDNVCR